MEHQKRSIRERFNAMRAAMRWSWQDIDTITGRKNSSTNIAKRVPAWSHLAIEVHEGYQAMFHQHLIEIISLRLGKKWTFSVLTGGAIMFISDDRIKNDQLPWIELDFEPGGFNMKANTAELYELAEHLKHLHPAIEDIIEVEGEYTVSVAVIFDPDPQDTLKRISKRSHTP